MISNTHEYNETHIKSQKLNFELTNSSKIVETNNNKTCFVDVCGLKISNCTVSHVCKTASKLQLYQS